MTCPTCGGDNPADKKFCGDCGTALENRCPQCAADNPVGKKFCGDCGAALRGTGDRARGSGLREPRSYTPKHLADKILQSKSALEGERKQVTVMFADVKGSMELAEQLDPEEWHAILDRFFAILSDGVHRFEGTVNQYTGDGIMALFGAPIAHEDHAQRACYAALHLRDEIKRYADELRRTAGVSLSARLGLNSGEVVVGRIGDDLRMDYTAQGHTVGLAQRMEQRAAADSAYLTEHTARLVEGYFSLRDLGAFDLKGASEPLTVYELCGAGAMRSRLDRSRARGFSRLVGRADELAVLETALNRSLEGRGGVVGIVADAGVGKSRLCNEFVTVCRARGIAVYEAHCPSHGKVVPLLPILEMFRDFFGITQNDSDQLAREKIAGRMLLLDRELEPFLPLAFEFLGVPDPLNPAPEQAPAARQRQLLTFTRRLVQARSAREPAVLLVDDAHWIDESSDAFIAQVADIVPGTRTMLLLNFRPEYGAEWMSRSSYQQLPLQPLGDAAIDALVVDLLGSDPSLARLPSLMRERTGGNPFFIEEIVHSLVESGSLVGQRGAYRLEAPIERVEIPPTVHGILAARIDRLPAREKSVLQTAAAIGLRFTEPLLRRVCDLSRDDHDAALAALRAADLIHEEAMYPELEYAFRHPLTHEVAEGSQLSAHRRRVHLAVARALEEVYADKSDEHAALLAHHWDLGGEALQAARWHRRAADWIAGGNASEALRHWRRVRELADQISDPTLASELGGRSRIMIIEYAWRQGVSEQEADELFREGEEWARSRDDSRALSTLYSAYGIAIALAFGQLSRARQLLEDGLQLARRGEDEALAFAIQLRLGLVLDYGGDVRAAAAVLEAVNAYPDAVKHAASPLVGYDAPAFARGYLGFVLTEQGALDEGARHIEGAIDSAQTRGAAEVLGWVRALAAEIWIARGDFSSAIASSRQSMEIAERIESPLSRVVAADQLSRALAADGQLDEAAAVAEHWVVDAPGTLLTSLPRAICTLARIRCARDQREQARSLAHEALAIAENHGFATGRLEAELLLAELALLEAEPDEAAKWLARADRTIDATGQSRRQPELLELHAKLARQRGNEAERTQVLRAAARLYREMGAAVHVERLEREIDS